MKRYLIPLFSTALLLNAASATAKTAAELTATGTPESQGEAIALEFDERDIGWVDVETDMEMILRQATGRESVRSQRIRILQNPGREEGDKSLITFDHPADVKGTAFLSYAKILDPDDQWLYLPALKRVKRIASNNKSGPFVGSEFAYEDITGNEVGKYRWKLLGMEACGDGLECFRLESIPKYEHSGYSRRIVLIDTEHFRLQKIDYYDRKNELYKTQDFIGYQQYLGEFWRADTWEMHNHQNGKSTILNFKEYRFKNGFSDRDFNKVALKRAR